jgi:2-polyprenyl-6-methoxyphenol hydroxylase-like FAD-dependent oxidoreductase
LGWKVPALLDSMDGDDDFYFDRINQIRMPCWSRGRVTLVGDAGYCVSPLAGFGGSMAIIGAGRLADALERYPDDHAAAFRHYENGLRPFVEEVQERAATNGLAMMFPADETELAERDRKLLAGEMDM